MPRRIRTLHPDERKKGINIEQEKYDTIRNAILKHLSTKREMKFMELTKAVERDLKHEFDGSINWYVTTIKLDLEARHEIERVPNKQPQFLRLANNHTN